MGPYRLHHLYAAGGAAEVYRGSHVGDGRAVAVKVLREEAVGDKQLIQAFRSEAAILETLQHEQLPRLRRFGEVQGRPALVLDFVTGETLRQLLQAGRAFDRLGALLAAVRAVAAVHAAGLIHNDVKLENFILQPDGRLCLVDFGSAEPQQRRLLARLRPGRRTLIATVTYVAPELLTGARPTPASDVYALGVCAHLLLAGTALFGDGGNSARLRRIAGDEAPGLQAKVPQLPSGFCKLIDACLRKQPRDRPTEAADLQRLLKRALGPEVAALAAALPPLPADMES